MTNRMLTRRSLGLRADSLSQIREEVSKATAAFEAEERSARK
jgi:hypothetical protein